jgi:ferredoxin-fold anticodon binding domain-containing protein
MIRNQDKNKLRIRFNCFVDNEGKIFTNVYNNEYNCQFPKNIRENGKFYEVNDDDVIIVESKTPFYKIKKNNIRILSEEESKIYESKKEDKKDNKEKNILDLSKLKIFDVAECVVCLSVSSSIIFIPCAHMCVCKDCYNGIKKTKNCCPLCRRNITKIIDNEKLD